MAIRGFVESIKKSPKLTIPFIFITWRLGILIVFHAATAIAAAKAPGEYPNLWTAHIYGDAAHYLLIARYGYGQASIMTGNIVTFRLFPLYPLLVRALSYLTFGNYTAAAVLVSAGCTLAALFLIWKLVMLDRKEGIAYRSLLYLLVFPSAVFLAIAYSEALFLLTVAASLYAARRGRWLSAGLWGMLCALSKPLGVVLVVVLAWEYLRQRGFSYRGVNATAFSLLLVPLGTFLYMAYQWSTAGDPFLFVKAQDVAHQRQFSPFVYRPIVRAFRLVNNGPLLEQHTLITLLNLVVLLLFIVLTAYAFYRLPSTYGVFMAVFILALLMTDSSSYPLASLTRYILPLLPAYILLADWGENRYLNALYLTLSTSLLVLCTAYLALGRYYIA